MSNSYSQRKQLLASSWAYILQILRNDDLKMEIWRVSWNVVSVFYEFYFVLQMTSLSEEWSFKWTVSLLTYESSLRNLILLFYIDRVFEIFKRSLSVFSLPVLVFSGSVDDHFSKSLGDVWTKVKASNLPKELDLLPSSVDDHFAKALGEMWYKIQAEKDPSDSSNSPRLSPKTCPSSAASSFVRSWLDLNCILGNLCIHKAFHNFWIIFNYQSKL